MIGILIATHGQLAEGLIDSVQLIMGEQTNYRTMALLHNTDIGEFGDMIVENVNELDEGEGVLIFTDLYAASPYNQSVLRQKDFNTDKFRVITGVNLPMLMETFALRNAGLDFETIWPISMSSGKDGITEFKLEYDKVKNR